MTAGIYKYRANQSNVSSLRYLTGREGMDSESRRALIIKSDIESAKFLPNIYQGHALLCPWLL